MKLGLLGALGGFAGAANEIADTSLKAREQARTQELADKSAEHRAQLADDRMDKREQWKLDREDARMRQRSGLLGEVLKKLPPEATDFDRARAATEAGLHDEAKPYLELAKAGDMSEHRERTFEANQAKWDAQIELQRARLEATVARGEASAANKSRELSFDEYQRLDPAAREQYDKFKGRSGGGDGATSLQKDTAWMVQNGMAPDVPTAFERLRSDPSESSVRNLTAQILADPRNIQMSAEEARKRAIGIIEAEQGGVARPASSAPQGAPAGAPSSSVDLNQFFK